MNRWLIFVFLFHNTIYAQDAPKSPDVVVKTAITPTKVELGHVSMTVAYRTLPLDSLCNIELRSIILPTYDTIDITLFLLDLARNGKVKLYYSFKEPPSEPDSGDINRIKSYDLSRVDNVIIYEQWLLDYNTMKTVVKIIGIAPAIRLNEKEYQPLFWALFPYNKRVVKDTRLYSGCQNEYLGLYEFFDERAFTSELLKVEQRRYR